MTKPVGDDRSAPIPPPLDYAPPRGGLPQGIQLTLGIVVALVVMMPLIFVGPILLGMAGAFLGPVVGVAIVGVLALHLRQSDRTRAMAAGTWAGVGIALLVDGVCWVTLVGM